jgi:hypothetical protein
VELLDREIVFAGPEYQFEGCDFGLEQPMYGSNIVHNLTVEAIRLYLVDGMGKNMSFSFYSWPQVKLTSLLQQCVDFLLKTHYFALDNIGDFDFLRGEDFIEDGVDVCSIDMVILMFGEILNELHDFDSVAICLDPYSKLGVLCLDLVDEVDEHVVHFILHELEIGRVEVGVVVYVRLYFRPPHLAAPLME